MANRPPRLHEFIYSGANRYFLTICVTQRSPVFAETEVGREVALQFVRIANAAGFEVIAYCVMPDHFHALVAGECDESNLKAFVHRFKQATGYWWKRGHPGRTRLWQEGYFDRILRDDDATEAVMGYILANPVRAGLVMDPRDYPLSGSKTYDVESLLEAAMFWTPKWKGGGRRRV